MKKILICIFVSVFIALLLSPAVSAANSRGIAVFIYQPVENTIGAGDQAFIDRLTAMGFAVKPVIDSECTTQDAEGAELLVIVESCSSANVKGKFSQINAPIFCSEMAAWEDIGLGVQTGAEGDVHPVDFKGDSVIEASLSSKSFDLFTEASTMVVMDPATVSADAVLIGQNADGNPPIVIYEKGAELIDGSKATSRRASGFIFGQTAVNFAPQTWELIEAVINWLSPEPLPETEPEKPAEEPEDPTVSGSEVTAAPQTADIFMAAVLILSTSGIIAGTVNRRKK